MKKSILIFIALAVMTVCVLCAGCTTPTPSTPTATPTVTVTDPIVGTWTAQKTHDGIIEDYKIEFLSNGTGTLYVTSYGIISDHVITWKPMGDKNYELDMDVASAGLYQKNPFTLNADEKSFDLIGMTFKKV